jgi:EAL domain-containing protein (putative c-di-GMP-specific phosphodiesterase class I)
VSRSVALAHIVRQSDGTSNGVWGVFTLRSAFQPIFTFHDGKLDITAFEGLLRPFRNDEGITPGAFFNAVAPQDRFHVETLSRTLHLLNAGFCLDKRARIFVNFDPSVFVDREIAASALRDMRLVLHEAEIAPERIVCEITEQKASSDAGLNMFVQALRDHGFAIAIDDYGAEESGIERINELKPDIVKFDAHWITHLMQSGPGFALLKTMVTQFEERGITTLFEGIEEPWQLELAEKCGTSMVQGFVLARPELAPTGFGKFNFERHNVNSGSGAGHAVAPDDVQAGADTDAPAAPGRRPVQRRTFGQRANRST